MRFLIPSLALIAVLCLGNIAMPVLALAQGQPAQGRLDVNINTHSSGGGGVWWQSPIWIAIGVIALVLFIMLIVMATRGGGTTVIKE